MGPCRDVLTALRPRGRIPRSRDAGRFRRPRSGCKDSREFPQTPGVKLRRDRKQLMGGCLTKSESTKSATAVCSSRGASSPVPICRNPLGPLRSWRWQRQFGKRNPLPCLARPAYCNKLVVFGDIDALHGRRHAKDLRFKRQLKVIFQHCVKPGRLFRFAVCVHQRFFDELIEPGSAEVKPFRFGVLPCSLGHHRVFLLLLRQAPIPPESMDGLPPAGKGESPPAR